MKEQPSLVVLAGGEARRLGGQKHSVELAGESLLARVLRRAAPICADRVVVARADPLIGDFNARVVYDDPKTVGALAGLAAGLEAAGREWALVLACDLPFVNRRVLSQMLTQREGCDAVIPRLKVGDEPLHALYHKRCLPAMLRALDRGQRRLSAFCADVEVRYVMPETWRRYDSEGLTFFNINTRADLARASELVGQETLAD